VVELQLQVDHYWQRRAPCLQGHLHRLRRPRWRHPWGSRASCPSRYMRSPWETKVSADTGGRGGTQKRAKEQRRNLATHPCWLHFRVCV
jgi:hypothetical protein